MTKEEFSNQQCYSTDNEAYKSWEDMMYELTEYYDIGESVEVWKADKVEWNHEGFIYSGSLIESMQDNAMDECGEVAEEYLNELTFDQKLDLEKHIAEWFNANAKINFYGVENEHKIMVVVE